MATSPTAGSASARQARVAELHGEGISSRAIGELLGVSKTTVLRDCAALSLEPHHGWSRRPLGETLQRVTLVCRNEACRRSYEVVPAKAERSHYCSVACMDEARRRFPAIERPCEQCGELFRPKASHAARGLGKFCGAECMGLAMRRYEAPPAELLCQECGGPLGMIRPAHYAHGRGRYCSRRCKVRHQWRTGQVGSAMLWSATHRQTWPRRWNARKPRHRRGDTGIAADHDRIGELLGQGLRPKAVATRLGISVWQVYRSRSKH